MLQSMTGYGKAKKDTETISVEVEIKTLNSKFLDLSLKISKDLSEKETDIRTLVQEYLERGKVNVNVDFQRKNQSIELPIAEELITAFYERLLKISQKVHADTTDVFRIAVQMAENSQKNVISTLSDDEWIHLQETLVLALKACKQFREQEGSVIQKKLLEYTTNIEILLQKINELDKPRLAYIREKLHQKMQELKNDDAFDKNRFEQELIYYIEKLDINEEKIRLQKHLEYLKEVLQDKNSNGKKINFISQEIGREINTIGSKANDATIQRYVVEMKEELEKIKEQSLNIL
jgi:uncharacterized protein (TIGR00255 family)